MTSQPVTLNAGSCPSLETIGAFLDGRFKDREREIVADHLASCETCYFVFTESARSRAASQQAAGRVVAFPQRRFVKPIAATLAAAASIALAVNLFMSYGGYGEAAALDELVAAVGTSRGFEPRLSGGFAYGPVRGALRAGQDDRPALSPDARIVVARIEKDYASKPAARIHGTAALVAGDVDRAITALEAAAGEQPDDAEVLSDLAAAYLVRADRSGSAEDASKALGAANRAVAVNRLLPEALFNRALALERSGLRAEARDAWQTYLAIDDQVGWADEARAHLRILSSQP